MTKIDTAQTYGIADIVKLGVLGKSFSAVKNVVVRDMIGDNRLKTKVYGTGRLTRFYIKGVNLIKFVSKK